MNNKPTFFLDFDRTLFDLFRMLQDFGFRHEDHFPKMKEIEQSDPPMDLSKYLYPETLSFLAEARKHYRLVILSRARSFAFYQKNKILGSKIMDHVDDLILTSSDDKGGYVSAFIDSGSLGHRFVDDSLLALESMKKNYPNVRTYLLTRSIKLDTPPEGADAIVTSLSLDLLK